MITRKHVIITTKVDIKTTIFAIFFYKNGSSVLKVDLLGRGDFFLGILDGNGFCYLEMICFEDRFIKNINAFVFIEKKLFLD